MTEPLWQSACAAIGALMSIGAVCFWMIVT